MKPGLNGGPDITGYNVNYRMSAATAWETFTHSGAGVTRTIDGLTADTEYQVRVQALNGETPSAWSDPSEAVSTNTETTLSSDATLSSLELSGITLNPAFSSSEITYTASVANTVSSTTVMAATTDDGASVAIALNGAVSDGTVNLEVGDNTITVAVTAENGTPMQTYTVTVNRASAGHAHDDLVSNLGQTDASTHAITTPALTRGQQFETGSNSDGYTLTEIVVNIRDARTGTPAFALYTSTADDKPGAKVVNLIGDSSTPGEQSFTPASTTTLRASTKYFIMFFLTAGQANLQRTASDDIDAGGSTGWDIAETSVYGTNRTTSSHDSVEIAVKGTAVGGTPPPVSTDATLSGLAVNDGSTDLTLTPTFASDTYAYAAKVASTVDEVTVRPTKNDTTATIAYLDASDMTLTDADTSATGQQVTLVEGDNVITVKVTAADGTATQTYTVTVNRPAVTTVTIAADQPRFTAELDDVTFTLTRTEDLSAALDVAVALTQDQDLLGSGHLAQTVTFGAGEATAKLRLSNFFFLYHTVTVDEVTLTATVQTGSGYEPGSPHTVSTRIVVADPAVTASIEATAYTFAEDATDATIAVILRTETGVPPPHSEINLSISTAEISGQAKGGDDYVGLHHQFRVFPSDFTPDGTKFTARKEVTLVIVDDALDEPDETLTVVLQRAPGSPEVLELRQPDGMACPPNQNGVPSCVATVTIVDNDAPAFPPTIVSVVVASTPGSGDTYGAGEDIEFSVTFSEAVNVAGDPIFRFELGNVGSTRDVDAAYESGSGTTALVFSYTVVSSDVDDNGISLYDGTDLDDPDGPVRLDSDDSIVAVAGGGDADLAWPSAGGRSRTTRWTARRCRATTPRSSPGRRRRAASRRTRGRTRTSARPFPRRRTTTTTA